MMMKMKIMLGNVFFHVIILVTVILFTRIYCPNMSVKEKNIIKTGATQITV